jgi:hypothetical protein
MLRAALAGVIWSGPPLDRQGEITAAGIAVIADVRASKVPAYRSAAELRKRRARMNAWKIGVFWCAEVIKKSPIR